MFSTLLERFPAYTIAAHATPDLLAQYSGLVPPELIEVWEQYGFGSFREGYLKIVNPNDYTDLLANSYHLTSTPSDAAPIVLFATGMGDLLVWERNYLILVDYRHGSTDVVGKNLNLFFKNHADDYNPRERMRWEPYPAAREQLGEPAYDECFGYVPLLALGGPETVTHLQKVKLREHIALIAEFTGMLER